MSVGEPKITVRGFGDNALTVQQRLATFELENSQCYDPNEEAKLHRAIATTPGGIAEFNAVVRRLAASVQLHVSQLGPGQTAEARPGHWAPAHNQPAGRPTNQ